MQSAILIYIVHKIVARDRHPWYIYIYILFYIVVHGEMKKSQQQQRAHTHNIRNKNEV